MLLFDSINSLSDINQLIKDAPSADGETSSFELKGTAGRALPHRNDKKRFAKEICAFANTYGGTLCIHKGKGEDIQPFDPEEAEELVRRLEGWSRDSLAPHCPMRLKVVDNHLLIGVDESQTKPHRSTADKHYYYRHETQSAKMPEIMIASLYRGQAVLQTRLCVWPSKADSDALEMDIQVDVTNLSRAPGTDPKIQVQLYSAHPGLFSYLGKMVEYQADQSGYLKQSFDGIGWINWNDGFSTNGEFQAKVLYPEDSLTLHATAKVHPDNPDKQLPRYIIVRTDAMFLQSARNVAHCLVDLEHDDDGKIESKIILQTDGHDLDVLAERFRRLTR